MLQGRKRDADGRACGCCKGAACVVYVVRFLRESQQDSNVLQDLPSDVLSPNTVAALLGHAVRAGDSLLLREVHQRALTDKLTLTTASCEVLLRGCSALVDSRAAKLLGEMIENGFERSESAPIAVVFSLRRVSSRPAG